MTIQCCKCKRIRIDGQWFAPVDPPGTDVSHTYCPTCAEIFLVEAFSAFASYSPRHAAQRLMQLLDRDGAAA